MINYFRPKAFELFRESTVYELIGVKIYKKYLPTTGDLIRRRRKIVQIKVGTTDLFNELTKYERKTRSYELRHIIGAIIFVLLALLIDRKFSIFDWVFLPILNLYINIYPIFLQRYNRIRIIRVLKKIGLTSPYDIVIIPITK